MNTSPHIATSSFVMYNFNYLRLPALVHRLTSTFFFLILKRLKCASTSQKKKKKKIILVSWVGKGSTCTSMCLDGMRVLFSFEPVIFAWFRFQINECYKELIPHFRAIVSLACCNWRVVFSEDPLEKGCSWICSRLEIVPLEVSLTGVYVCVAGWEGKTYGKEHPVSIALVGCCRKKAPVLFFFVQCYYCVKAL